MLQRLPIEKLHRNEGLTVVFADFMDGANIWMVQGGSSLRLTVETAESLGVWREPVWKELQGNEAVQLGVLGLVHHTHTATTQLFEDAVMGEGLSDERVGVRHGAAILALATPSGWLYDPETRQPTVK